MSLSKEYIVLTLPYQENSAGIRCLYHLIDELIKKGYNAYSTHQSSPLFPVPSLSNWEIVEKIADGAIAVYPEVVSGNPAKASTVARWVLNIPGKIGGDKVYDTNELVFTYSSMLDRFVSNAISGHLFYPTINLDMWKDKGEERTLEVFYRGKGNIPKNFNREGKYEITRNMPSRDMLPAIFNKAKVLHTFDGMTALIHEAIACGCPVWLHDTYGLNIDDMATSEYGLTGTTFNEEGLTKAMSETKLLPNIVRQAKLNFSKQLDDFINITQNKAGYSSL